MPRRHERELDLLRRARRLVDGRVVHRRRLRARSRSRARGSRAWPSRRCRRRGSEPLRSLWSRAARAAAAVWLDGTTKTREDDEETRAVLALHDERRACPRRRRPSASGRKGRGRGRSSTCTPDSNTGGGRVRERDRGHGRRRARHARLARRRGRRGPVRARSRRPRSRRPLPPSAPKTRELHPAAASEPGRAARCRGERRCFGSARRPMPQLPQKVCARRLVTAARALDRRPDRLLLGLLAQAELDRPAQPHDRRRGEHRRDREHGPVAEVELGDRGRDERGGGDQHRSERRPEDRRARAGRGKGERSRSQNAPQVAPATPAPSTGHRHPEREEPRDPEGLVAGDAEAEVQEARGVRDRLGAEQRRGAARRRRRPRRGSRRTSGTGAGRAGRRASARARRAAARSRARRGRGCRPCPGGARRCSRPSGRRAPSPAPASAPHATVAATTITGSSSYTSTSQEVEDEEERHRDRRGDERERIEAKQAEDDHDGDRGEQRRAERPHVGTRQVREDRGDDPRVPPALVRAGREAAPAVVERLPAGHAEVLARHLAAALRAHDACRLHVVASLNGRRTSDG